MCRIHPEENEWDCYPFSLGARASSLGLLCCFLKLVPGPYQTGPTRIATAIWGRDYTEIEEVQVPPRAHRLFGSRYSARSPWLSTKHHRHCHKTLVSYYPDGTLLIPGFMQRPKVVCTKLCSSYSSSAKSWEKGSKYISDPLMQR